MFKIAILLQQNVIDDKLKNAPDSSYAIGVWIGNILPFIILVGLAYYMYYRSKNKKD